MREHERKKNRATQNKALTEPYILLRTREITKMYELPKIHRGYFRKKLQKVGQKRGSNRTQEQVANFRNPAKFL